MHCYVVIELKNTAFRPEYVGKLNFYLAAVDDLVRNQTVDAPTIGLVLCKSKKGTVVEYALRDIHTPMGSPPTVPPCLMPWRASCRASRR